MKKKLIYVCQIAFVAILLFSFPAFAGSLEGTQLVTGSKNLLRDLAGVLTGLVALLTIALSIKNVLAWQAASDEEKPKHKKSTLTTLQLGVLGTTIAGVITAILSYYGG
jgi:hypothetical protein